MSVSVGKNSVALPFLSALLFWISFPPINAWPLMWIAPVPLLYYMVQRPLTWRRAGVLYLAAYLLWVANVYWFWFVTPVGMVLAPLYRAFLWPAYAWLLQKIRGPKYVTAPALWVLQEYLALHFPLLGFPFKLIGYSQIEMLAFVQVADMGGVFLVGFLIVMFAALLATAEQSQEKSWRIGAIVGASAIVLSFAYGMIRLSTLEIKEGPKVLLVQPNIPQDVKEIVAQRKETEEEREDRMHKIFAKHMTLTREGLKEPVDLVVWPEATVPGLVLTDRNRRFLEHEESYPWLAGPPAIFKTPFISGASIYELGNRKIYNSAVWMDGGGRVLGRFDKVDLVAFGEYVPDAFSWFVEHFSGLLPNGSPGTDYVVWQVSGMKLGPEICFEGLVPEITREIARKGAQAIVNISNDGWFKSSSELDETLAIARFRSLETRVGFVRSTNTGISALIDPAGRVIAQIDGKEVEGTLVGRVPWTEAGSIYRRVGNLFVLLCGIGMAGLSLYSLTRK